MEDEMSLWNPEHHQIYTAPPWPTTNISCHGDELTQVKTQMSSVRSLTVLLFFLLFVQDTLNPKWNSNCQFFIKDLEQDVLCVTVFERDQFSPDGR